MSGPQRDDPLASNAVEGQVRTDPWRELARLTPARIALGRSGASLPTREVLEFALAHARARDAVRLPADLDTLAEGVAALGWEVERVGSRAASREDYLRRPDYGRSLSPESASRLGEPHGEKARIALVVGDGLSATAIHENALGMLAALKPHLDLLGPIRVFAARNARVALADEIGERIGAEAAIILIGERPGLSSPDSLGAYLTLGPRVGRTDADRNCISNIRAAGLGYDEAAARLAWILRRAFSLGYSGVRLKDDSRGVDAIEG